LRVPIQNEVGAQEIECCSLLVLPLRSRDSVDEFREIAGFEACADGPEALADLTT